MLQEHIAVLLGVVLKTHFTTDFLLATSQNIAACLFRRSFVLQKVPQVFLESMPSSATLTGMVESAAFARI